MKTLIQAAIAAVLLSAIAAVAAEAVPPKGNPFERASRASFAGRRTNSVGMVFVGVPGTDVRFCIWETRVRDYAAYAQANAGVDGSWQKVEYDGLPVSNGPDHPVSKVSWNDAEAFCDWLTRQEQASGWLRPGEQYRLPTDAEWSVAVGLPEESGRTPKEKHMQIKDVYPWGTQWPPPNRAGNYDDYSSSKIPGFTDGFERTAPVGSFQPNKFGLYDLGGNVGEWCEDWYDNDQKRRVGRGGSFADDSPRDLLSSCRIILMPDSDRRSRNGFRVVLVVVGSVR